MICPKCKEEGVLNSANSKKFYFCKTCREEIQLEVVESPKTQCVSNPLLLPVCLCTVCAPYFNITGVS